MKIYSYDRGVYGLFITVASSPKEALENFNKSETIDAGEVLLEDFEKNFEEHEIVDGLVIDNWGDT